MRDLKALTNVFRRHPGVQAVYLFGSAAADRAGPESDIDLAVVPRSEGTRAMRLQMLADLVRAGFDDVDLVFLEGDDLVLAYEAVRQNRLVYQTSDFDRGAMYSKVVRMYLDLRPYLELQREAYKRRILGAET